MIDFPRKKRPTCGKTLARKNFVPGELRFVHRPQQIETRKWPGHSGGGVFKGDFNPPCFGPVVEYKTCSRRCRMNGCAVPDSLTYDRGSKMTCHVELVERRNLDIWFAAALRCLATRHQRKRQQAVRQFLPKGMDSSGATRCT